MKSRSLHVLLGAVLLLSVDAAVAVILPLESGVVELRGETYSVLLDLHGEFSGATGAFLRAPTMDGAATVSGAHNPLIELVAGSSRLPILPQLEGFEIIGQDSLIIRSTLQTSLPSPEPLHIRHTLVTMHHSVRMELEFTASDTLHILEDVFLDIRGEENSFLHFVNTHNTIDAGFKSPEQNCYGMQLGVVVRNPLDRMMIVPDNPYYGYFLHDDDGLRNVIFRTHPSHGIEPGPPVHSVLRAGDRVVRKYTLIFSEGEGVSVLPNHNFTFLSPHPDGRDGSLGLLGDDIPLRDNWTPITVPDDPAEPSKSAIVRLLNDHPQFKLNLIMVYDKLGAFYSLPVEVTDGWRMNRGNLSYTPFESFAGDRSLRMEVSQDSFVYVEQDVLLEVGDVVRLRTNYLPGGELTGDGRLVFSLQKHNGDYEESVHYQGTPGGWLPVDHIFPGPLTEAGSYKFRIALEYGGCSAFVDELSLEANGNPVPLRNAGFETGRTHIEYLGPLHRWSDASASMCVARNATDEYREFLHRLDSKTVLYGFEDRLGTGIHALHHSSGGDFVGDALIGQDFTLLDRDVHRSTMERIFSDWEELGLGRRSVDLIRTSGIHYQQTTVQEALRHQIRWMDMGVQQEQRSPFPCYGEGEFIWLQHTIAWLDEAPNSGWSRMGPTYETLAMGGTAIWGFHPRALFEHNQNVNGRQWLSEQISQIQQLYPHSGWDRVEDIAYRGRSLDSLSIILPIPR